VVEACAPSSRCACGPSKQTLEWAGGDRQIGKDLMKEAGVGGGGVIVKLSKTITNGGRGGTGRGRDWKGGGQ
jgi:hypothetical protein